MKEKLVSYEIAMLAQEKGFPKYNFKEYRHMHTYTSNDKTGEIELDGGEYATIVCLAPTQSQLQTWLRDNNLADISIIRGGDKYYPVDNVSGISLTSLSVTLVTLNWTPFDTYEEALEEALINAFNQI
jgi:hypothetical protein